jgi:predicted double-glycine peptidase
LVALYSFRYVSLNKKIRDLERMVKREGMPAEIVESKRKDLKKLKQEQTYKKNAIRNQSKYRAIRLNEKKK